MRISRTLAIATIVGLTFLSANRQSPATLDRRGLAAASEDHPDAELDDTFVYDVVTRFNESLIANIDAIDTAVTAVLAGNVAIVVFAIERFESSIMRKSAGRSDCWPDRYSRA